MIAFKVNGRFLDLKPGTSFEIEKKSPFFSMEEYASESTNSPITFLYSPNNALALDLPFHLYTERTKKTVTAEYYDNQTYRGRCTIIIETGKLNLNNIEATEMSGYALFGLSQFFIDIKGKYLKDLSFGGTRSFAWTTANPTDGSGGFWQHIHATWTDATIPYVFAPIRNEAYFTSAGSVDWMNGLGNDGKIKNDPIYNPIVPMPRLKYLLEQIFLEFNWSVDFAGLNDTTWENIILTSTKAVDWFGKLYLVISGVGGYSGWPKSPVEIKLNEHVSQQQLISDFIIQWFYRFGWAPLFEPLSRTCYIVAAKEAPNWDAVDWTAYANPNIDSSFSNDSKVFSLENNIDSNDEFPSAPDFTGKTIAEPVFSKDDLPAASYLDEGVVRFCFLDNKWYQISLDDTVTPNDYIWTVFADNIYNDTIDNSTDTITTNISTLPIYLTEYRDVSGTKYYGHFPFMKQDTTKPFGIRALLYLGMQYELNSSGTAGLIQYPMSSCVCINNLGVQVLDWSIPYQHTKDEGTILQVQYGSRPYWWDVFLSVIAEGEEDQQVIYLPATEVERIAWNKRILIANIPFLLKSFIQPQPYAGFVQATLFRMLPQPADASVAVPSPLYAKLEVINIAVDTLPSILWSAYRSCNVRVSLFTNLAGTVPYTPPLAVPVVVKTVIKVNGSPIQTTLQSFNVKTASDLVKARVLYDGTNAFNSDYSNAEYTLDTDPNGIYTII